MTTDSRSNGGHLLHYRLLAPVTALARDIWRAEDTRTGRTVFLKILSRSLPKEKGRRDALLSKLRQSGAFVHPAFPLIWEIAAAEDDVLFMSTEWIEGERLTGRAAREIPSREEFIKWAWQLGEALAVMHKRELVHGNFSGDNVFIDVAGNLRLLGLGLSALDDRRERGDVTMFAQTKTVDLEALAFRSPEELDGLRIDQRSDIFSAGSILYLIATGKPPFFGSNVAEVIHAVTKTNPRNPLETNPQLQQPLLQLIGRSIFKNPAQRYASVDALLSDIEKLEPQIRTLAAYPKAEKEKGEAPGTRLTANVVVAELPYYDVLSAKQPERAVRLSAKMQQIVGEAIYLYDGEIIDSIGPRLVAIVPDAAKGVDAVRRAIADLAEHNDSSSDPVEPRIALHRGEIVRREHTIEGPAAALLDRVVSSLEPMQVLVSEPLLRAASISGGGTVGAIDGVNFASLPPLTPAAVAAVDPLAVLPPQVTAALTTEPPLPPIGQVSLPVEDVSSSSSPARTRARTRLMPVAAAAIVVVIAGGVAAMLMTRGKDEPPPAVRVAAKPQPAAPSKLYVGSIVAADANGADIAPAIIELLRQSGKIELTSTPAGAALQLTVRQGATPGEAVPQLTGKGEGPAVQLTDAGAATGQLLRWAGEALQIPTASLVAADPAAMSAFARAAALFRSPDAAARSQAVSAIAEALAKDPKFVPAHRLALEIHEAAGDREQLMTTATQLIALHPDDAALRRRLMGWQLEAGRGAEALANVPALLQATPNDLMALQAVGRLALSAGDAKTFGRAVERLERIARPADRVYVHRPDIFATAGDFDRAAQMYYDIETREADNPTLALKIGRIAALRESWEIAGMELKKLERLSPHYGAPLLAAFIAAQKKDAATAEGHLTRALANAAWHDDIYTHAAEIHAMLSQKEKVIAALEKAFDRGEANITPVLLKQPFFYIGYDGRSSKLRTQMEQRRDELRAALGTIRL